LPNKSRKKRTITRPRSQSPAPTIVTMKPSSQTQVRGKDDFADPSRYARIRVELKMIGIISGIILAFIVILYFVLR
jgi:hypothetical protein